MSNPKCRICGTEMRQTRRGATRKKRGPSYVCPADEAELYTDANGHLQRVPGAKHPWLRAWELHELGAQ